MRGERRRARTASRMGAPLSCQAIILLRGEFADPILLTIRSPEDNVGCTGGATPNARTPKHRGLPKPRKYNGNARPRNI
ncbi:hypothetical protein SAMD00023353_8300380 [Rosellinia necatrix]|uniref:Uncharacterized protein n=1 Tax=Rosellinia necatrix TaxID=77044 RepID=A0A1W2TUU1_ROSNE|nr:hypothetical protein SAMD00023353_8300380 [Rosellinia necatrix]